LADALDSKFLNTRFAAHLGIILDLAKTPDFTSDPAIQANTPRLAEALEKKADLAQKLAQPEKV
jgi:hypothetical protein